MSGGLDEILRYHRESPGGRLAILGAAGTGKTAPAVLLVLAALRARRADDPVPALIGVASWDPHHEHVVDHLSAQLIRDHPYLMNAEYGPAAASGLLTSGRVTPVLDGLDELTPDRRPAALTELNRSGLSRMVLTSRLEEYEDATGAVVLTGAAVVELLPPHVDAVIGFISAGCAPRLPTRWEPVFTAMRADPSGPVPTALTNPLTLALARLTYVDRDPADLLDRDRFGTARAVRDHLIDGFVPALYDPNQRRDDPSRRLRYGRPQALHWLAYLAGQMEHRRLSDLAWWHIPTWFRPPCVCSPACRSSPRSPGWSPRRCGAATWCSASRSPAFRSSRCRSPGSIAPVRFRRPHWDGCPAADICGTAWPPAPAPG